MFIKYGRSARHLYKLTREPQALDEWETAIPTLLRDIPNIETYASLLVGGQADAKSDATLKASSQLITMYPSIHRQPRITLVTKYIANHLYQVVLKCNREKFWSYFNQFWSVSRTHTSAGWLWDCHVKKELSDGQKRSIPLVHLPITQTPPSAEQLIDLPFSMVQTHGDQEDLAITLSEISPALAAGGPSLFIAGASNQATFDSFSIQPGVDLHQHTIDENHSVKAKGLDFIWDSLVRAQELCPPYRQEIASLKPTKTKKWRVIFVIPRRISHLWKTPRPIDYAGLKPKRAWDDYIDQFVMVLDDDGDDDGVAIRPLRERGMEKESQWDVVWKRTKAVGATTGDDDDGVERPRKRRVANKDSRKPAKGRSSKRASM